MVVSFNQMTFDLFMVAQNREKGAENASLWRSYFLLGKKCIHHFLPRNEFIYLHHLGSACQKVQDPRSLSLVKSFALTMVLKAELWS